MAVGRRVRRPLLSSAAALLIAAGLLAAMGGQREAFVSAPSRSVAAPSLAGIASALLAPASAWSTEAGFEDYNRPMQFAASKPAAVDAAVEASAKGSDPTPVIFSLVFAGLAVSIPVTIGFFAKEMKPAKPPPPPPGRFPWD
mmetsp:Transcript_98970/g.284389  ORF Transcript_98970/g.284389 Transcript_98970/m.284389 type:complete len:142 (-) Transcript_98970:71-496(-)